MSTDTNNARATARPLSSGDARGPRAGRRATRGAAFIGLWVLAVAAGLGGLARYAATPGPATSAPDAWPEQSALARRPGAATLVLFLHPRCPCSTATLGELERALAWNRDGTSVCVVFVRPEGSDAAWAETSLRGRVENLRPDAIVDDIGGREAARFGAVTSGEVLVYDAAGRLAFAGGVTPSRGHEGDNAGRAAVEAFLAGRGGRDARTPVFGCPLCSTCTTAHGAPDGGEATP